MSALRPVGRFALPAALPAGERILWQGAPEWRALARNALHLRGIALYLAAVVTWVGVHAVLHDKPAGGVVLDVGRAGLAAMLPLAIGLLYARLAAGAAAYTITNRRVVLRMGIGLPITLNLPYAKIDAAGLTMKSDGTGDIALRLAPGTKGLSWLILWPHARPWRFGQAEPMLRGLADAANAGRILSQALAVTQMEPAALTLSLAQVTGSVDSIGCNHGATSVAA